MAQAVEGDDYIDGFIGQRAEQWLGQYNRRKPFFLHASLCGPHFPLDPPAAYFRRHHPENMPEPIAQTDPEAIRYHTQHRAMYAGMIEVIDAQVERLLRQLQQTGLDRNTVVIFVTDHGDMLGDLGYQHKSLPYDGSCRTPLAICWPGVIPAGRRLDGMAESVDLPATLIEIAGGQPLQQALPQSPGRSFLPYVTGAVDHHRDFAYAEVETHVGPTVHPHRDPMPLRWRMCCERDWKYIRHRDGREELYDRRADPDEAQNLADHPGQKDRLARMRGQLIDAMSACIAPDRPRAAPAPAPSDAGVLSW